MLMTWNICILQNYAYILSPKFFLVTFTYPLERVLFSEGDMDNHEYLNQIHVFNYIRIKFISTSFLRFEVEKIINNMEDL